MGIRRCLGSAIASLHGLSQSPQVGIMPSPLYQVLGKALDGYGF
ncbi:MAG: hypothetical protein AAF921_14545 [Cyanobacteria bacterium P01_D01_bin.44]